jgi:hypothetical protein
VVGGPTGRAGRIDAGGGRGGARVDLSLGVNNLLTSICQLDGAKGSRWSEKKSDFFERGNLKRYQYLISAIAIAVETILVGDVTSERISGPEPGGRRRSASRPR